MKYVYMGILQGTDGMKAEIKIKKGWRQVKRGLTREDDEYYVSLVDAWQPVKAAGCSVEFFVCVIRKRKGGSEIPCYLCHGTGKLTMEK